MKRLERTKKLRVWRQDNFKCQLRISSDCIFKLNINNATVDHKIATCNKGTNDLDNLQTACIPCNLKKSLLDRREKQERRRLNLLMIKFINPLKEP